MGRGFCYVFKVIVALQYKQIKSRQMTYKNIKRTTREEYYNYNVIFPKLLPCYIN